MNHVHHNRRLSHNSEGRALGFSTRAPCSLYAYGAFGTIELGSPAPSILESEGFGQIGS